MLTSTISDSLVDLTPKPTIVSYFCDYADKRTLDPVTILGSVAHSLLQNIEISAPVQKLIETSYDGGLRSPGIEDVISIVKRAVEESSDTIILIVDGLDELKEEARQAIYNSLKTFLGIEKVVKVLISSRVDETENISVNKGAQYRLLVVPDSIASDIGEYVRNEVRSLRSKGRLAIQKYEMENVIAEALINGAKGM